MGVLVSRCQSASASSDESCSTCSGDYSDDSDTQSRAHTHATPATATASATATTASEQREQRAQSGGGSREKRRRHHRSKRTRAKRADSAIALQPTSLSSSAQQASGGGSAYVPPDTAAAAAAAQQSTRVSGVFGWAIERLHAMTHASSAGAHVRQSPPAAAPSPRSTGINTASASASAAAAAAAAAASSSSSVTVLAPPPPQQQQQQQPRSASSSPPIASQAAVHMRAHVPVVVSTLVALIRRYGMNEEHIFRIPADESVVRTCVARINAAQGVQVDALVESLVGRNPHLMAALLKRYFSLLPQPIIPASLHTDLLDVRVHENPVALRKLIRQFPATSLALLDPIVVLMRDLCANEAENKMNFRAMATCWMPNLFHLQIADLSRLADVRAAIAFISLLISQYDVLLRDVAADAVAQLDALAQQASEAASPVASPSLALTLQPAVAPPLSSSSLTQAQHTLYASAGSSSSAAQQLQLPPLSGRERGNSDASGHSGHSGRSAHSAHSGRSGASASANNTSRTVGGGSAVMGGPSARSSVRVQQSNRSSVQYQTPYSSRPPTASSSARGAHHANSPDSGESTSSSASTGARV